MNKAQRLRALGLLVVVAVAFVIASVYFHDAGVNLLPQGSKYDVSAIVPTTVALANDADVRIAGVDVGNVTKIEATGTDGTDSLVGMSLKPNVKLYRDAQALIASKSVAGENFVELTPGNPSSGTLPANSVLGINTAQDATQIDQVLSIFDGARQKDLQAALGGLGTGLGQGQGLNATLEAVSALPDEGSAAVATMAGDKTQLAQLISTFDTIASTLGQRGSAIRSMTVGIKNTAQAVAARNTQLRLVLDRLAPLLRQVQTTANRLGSFSNSATPVISNLRVASDDLVPTVKVLLPAAREGETVVSNLKQFTSAVQPALRRLSPFSKLATTMVPQVSNIVRAANPLVSYVSPYLGELGSFFSLDAASLQASDKTSHIARILLPISIQDVAGVLTTSEMATLKRLLGSFDTIGNNAYPTAGQVGDDNPFTGNYKDLSPDPPYGG